MAYINEQTDTFINASGQSGCNSQYSNQSGCNSQYSNQSGGLQSLPGIPQPSSFQQRMDNFGCAGLNSRKAILQSKLNGLQSSGTNPRWINQLRNKIRYIDNKLRLIRC